MKPDITRTVTKIMEKYYEDSVDAYHAFMGTYTDAVSDDEAPDRLIDEAVHKLVTLVNEARIELSKEFSEEIDTMIKRAQADPDYTEGGYVQALVNADGVLKQLLDHLDITEKEWKKENHD